MGKERVKKILPAHIPPPHQILLCDKHRDGNGLGRVQGARGCGDKVGLADVKAMLGVM